MLAEIYKEGEDFKKSWKLYKPLIDDILKDSNKPFDETALRIFDGAGQACLQLGDVQNLTAVAAKLMELGPDQGQINLTIMNIAKRLEILRKKALAEGDSGDRRRAGRGRGEAEAAGRSGREGPDQPLQAGEDLARLHDLDREDLQQPGHRRRRQGGRGLDREDLRQGE